MGTAKRDRQRANKAQREQEVARDAAKSRTLRWSLLIGGAIIAVFAIVAIAGPVFLDKDKTDDTIVTDDGVVTTDDTTVTDDDVVTTDAAAVDGESAVSSTECPPVGGADEKTQTFDGPPPFCLDPDVAYSAKVSTTVGDITIALDQEAAPNTVNNFVFLARHNYFTDTECHRVIQGFVTQCGDPTGTGTGGPGYQFDDELPAAGAYEIGSIAMANSGPDTNGSQVFIISGERGAQLPPDYSLFGVVSGEGDLDVVAKMDAVGSTDDSGVSTEELRILDVEIIEG